METKEKRPERTRSAQQSPERRKRPASGEDRERREKRAAKPDTERKKPSAGAAGQTREKSRPAARPDQRPQRRREETAERPQRRQRPEESRPKTKRQSAPAEQPRRRPIKQDDGIPYSAPKGTGPRKSAPKMTREEAEELLRKQQSQPHKEPEKKKKALQNFISGIRGKDDTLDDPAEQAARRRKERAAKEERKKQNALRHDTPAVIYTQPQVFNRDRLLLQLLTVTAVVAAMVLGMSLFFRVGVITVAGEKTYSKDAIVDASGIKEGDGLLTFSKARASAKIRAQLHFVDKIRIGIKLPDTVTIYVEELDVTYAIESIQGDLWLINSNGKVVKQITEKEAGDYTKINGVTLLDPTLGSQAMAADEIPTETLESGDPVPITVTGAQRLSSALQILVALEANDIVGEAASLDVSELEDVRMWYGNQYEVLLGNTAQMEYKIACMNDAILQMSDFQSGILDVSFVTWPDKVGYTPFG